ncbi:MAG: hypothetical protein L0L69_07450 [Propionibacterium sp.]|nr:hypothetical protein [Propionibacterium sp.]
MIISRGAGILAFLAFGLAVGIGAFIASAMGSNPGESSWTISIGMLVSAGLVHLLGQYLNVTRPTAIFERVRGRHLGEVSTSLAKDGLPEPLSLSEQSPLTFEESAVLRRMKNQHTMFWIPMRWYGLVFLVASLSVANSSLF